MRSWALRSAHAKERVKRVDERRLAVLTRVWSRRAGEGAADYAALEYSAFLGAIQLFESPSAAPAERVERLLGKALTKLSSSGRAAKKA